MLVYVESVRRDRTMGLEKDEMSRIKTLKINASLVALGDIVVEFQNGTQDAHLLTIREVKKEIVNGDFRVTLTSESGETRRRVGSKTVSVLWGFW
jgi:hypothetical protein